MIKKLLDFFFFVFPVVSYQVHGSSMEPAYKEKQKLLAQKKWFFCIVKKNDVVVLRDPRNMRLILKRVIEIRNNQYFVKGDNEKKSTDSRVFGWISKKNIIGKIIN